LPQTEIDRLTVLGFLQSIDDERPTKSGTVKAAVNHLTGVKDDPRVNGG
jgi:hypothetical protein